MKIQCQNCQHEGTVPDDKVPAAGISVSCPKCKTKFQITPPPDSPPKANFYCPKCETQQPESDICIKCGIVFSKYYSAQANQKPEVEELPPKNPEDNEVPINTDEQSETNFNQQTGLLIKCHVCNSMISKNASCCPNCGEPNKTHNNIKYITISITLILALCVALYFIVKSSKKMSTKSAIKATVQKRIYTVDSIKYNGYVIGANCQYACRSYSDDINTYLSEGYQVVTSSSKEMPADTGVSTGTCTCVGTEYVIQK